LPSTKSTILESWPDLKSADRPRQPIYHFAVKQEGVNLDFHLEQFFGVQAVSFHFFDNFETLVTICRRFSIDAIVIGGRSGFLQEVELVQAIKQNVFLSIIPIILYHPDPEDNLIVAAYENGVEEFIYGEWKDRLVEVRIRGAIERSRRDWSINPTTHLPGPTIIEREINRQLKLGAEFAVAYADLDSFKAYNDYYGYIEGDKVIRLSAMILKDVVFDLCREGFVGHIAGDDFIIIIPAHLVDQVCSWIIRTFDVLVPYRYETEDRRRGYVTTTNRNGHIKDFPILTISIAVLINIDRKFTHIGEMSKMLADLKKATKQQEGSTYMVERRKKY
jgi:GGDEF domain-containing protein